jgi:excisionase family DNA binding protein
MQALTIAEAASRLGVSRWTVSSLIRSGELPAVHVGAADAQRRTLRILPDDWQAFLARRQGKPAQPRQVSPGLRARRERLGIS